MANVEEQDERLSKIKQSVDQSRWEVGKLKKGSEQLTKSNEAMVLQVWEIKNQLDSRSQLLETMSETLLRLEPANREIQAAEKLIALTSDTSNQVVSLHPGTNRPELQLGDRGISGALANRERIWYKVDMPVFNGSSPFGWMAQVERFFRLGNYSDEQKLNLVSVSLAGPGLSWFNWEIEHELFKDWADFKQRMLDRFGQSWLDLQENVVLKKELISQIVEEPKAIPAEDLLHEEKWQGSRDSQMTMEVDDDENTITTPRVSLNALEPDHKDKLFEGFDTNMVLEDQQHAISEVLSPNFAGLHSKMAQIGENSTCVQYTHSAYNVFDELTHRGHTFRHKRKQRKCFKSWKFKFKQRHHKSKLSQLVQHKHSKRRNIMNTRLCTRMILVRDMVELGQSICGKVLQWMGGQVNEFQILHIGMAKRKVAQRQRSMSAEDKNTKNDAEHGLYAVFYRIKHSYKLLLLLNISENWLDRLIQRYNVRQHLLNRKRHVLLLYYTNVDIRISSLVWHCWKNKHLQNINMKQELFQVQRQDKNGHFFLQKTVTVQDKMRMKLIERSLNQSIIVVGEFKMKHKWRDKLTQQVFELELFLNSVGITLGVDIWCAYMDKMMAAILLFQGLVVQPNQEQFKTSKTCAFMYNHKMKELAKWDITMNHLFLSTQTSLWFRMQVQLLHVQLQQMNLLEFSKSKLCEYNTRRRRLQTLELATGRVTGKNLSLYVLLQFFSLQKLEDKLSSNGGVLIRHEEYSGEVKVCL